MISMDGEDHSRNRRIVSRGFTPAVVRTYEDQFRRFAVDIVERALDEAHVDFVAAVASQLPLYAICDLLGVPDADRAQLQAWTKTLTVPTEPEYAPSRDEFTAAVNGIWEYGMQLADMRRRHPGRDVMSTIIAAVDQDRLSDDEVMGFTLTLAAAGNETTRSVISHGLLALLRHPDQLEWLRDKADGISTTAVEEILRWASPVIHSRRTVVREVELHGVQLAEGEAVAVLYPAANLDPRRFPGPLRFDLQRQPNPHLTFATGPHVCLGAHVARLETRILFEELLGRTDRIELDGPCEYVRDNELRGVKRLPVLMTRSGAPRNG
jgi:cholest-4-en-3-one 26-monooxygenase